MFYFPLRGYGGGSVFTDPAGFLWLTHLAGLLVTAGAVLVVIWADRGLDLRWIVIAKARLRPTTRRPQRKCCFPRSRSFAHAASASPGCYRPRFSSASTA
jgi:hypothetical protein